MINNESTTLSGDSCSLEPGWGVSKAPEFSAPCVVSVLFAFLAIALTGLVAKSFIQAPSARKKEHSKRKKEFLYRAGARYGYGACEKGHIDTWRDAEFPQLIRPSLQEDSEDQRIVYLDYAGAALPAKSQLEAILSDSSVLANPHSTGPAASRTLLLIEQAKKRVLEHFNCEPGRFAGLENVSNCAPADLHPGYEVVFTSGATESLRIVAERFPWTTCRSCSKASNLVYAHNSHTSVVGMRASALANGAHFQCRPLDEICSAQDPDEFVMQQQHQDDHKCSCRHENLLVVPAECNFGGTRPNVKTIVQRSKRWYTMVDYAKAASTGVVDLKDDDPDFACVSFYKLFGEPTGLGALFVRRSAIPMLMKSQSLYFGGGSVDVVLPSSNFKVARQLPSLLASLTNGTVHYRGIASLIHGFDEIQSLGGMPVIHRHAACLAGEFVRRLRQLKHGNGKPAVVIYGAWRSDTGHDRGPTVAFNVLRSDSSFVGYNEVSKLAELHNPPIQLRTGCFCNPGACQEAIGLKDNDVKQNYFTNGHVCGDHIDVVDGKPTGAIRVSFGKDSIWEDLDCLVSFLEQMFVNRGTEECDFEVVGSSEIVRAQVTEMYIFPIKSCGAQRVKSWSLEPTSGRFSWDREFALVDSSGTAMRLQRYPQMSQIQPFVDLDSMTITVSAPGCKVLVLSLCADVSGVEKPNGLIQVCGNKCGGKVWGSHESSTWFSSFLGVQCWLARHTDTVPSSNTAFANEESILLISQNAVDRLNQVLKAQGQRNVQTKHFRPNIVVSVNIRDERLSESSWKVVERSEGRLSFETAGECARCSMVDIDPTTGMKGKTLRALADHNRSNGRITFGIFLRRPQSLQSDYDDTIAEGDNFLCHTNTNHRH